MTALGTMLPNNPAINCHQAEFGQLQLFKLIKIAVSLRTESRRLPLWVLDAKPLYLVAIFHKHTTGSLFT